jgi:hypothetical protein
MKTHLDQQIEHLENLVDKHLNLNLVERDETRCNLPDNQEELHPHKFLVAMPNTSSMRPERFCNSDESHELCRLCRLFFDIPSSSLGGNSECHVLDE